MQRLWAFTVLLVTASTGCFKDEGGTTIGADDATASASTTSTSLAPTTSGTSTPMPDVGAPDGTTTSGGESTSEAESTATSDASTTDDPSTTTGPPPAECGNGIIEGDEGCDDGPMNADDALCTSTCALAKCGDGLLQEILEEECDFGVLNHDNGACTKVCKTAKCGDGFVFFGVEECDEGEKNQADLYGGCTPMTCTLGPHCGDDEVQKPFEECDHGDKNGADGDMCTKMCALDGNVVFVTSKLYTGHIGAGGIAAADDKCNTVAMEGKLPNAGAFRAWISDGTASPTAWDPKPAGPFLLLDGTPIAADWADLVDGQLAAPLGIKEDGLPIETSKVAWTGTSFEGLPLLGQHCVQWTNETKDEHGAWGDLEAVGKGWTNYTLGACQDSARLICVEQ